MSSKKTFTVLIAGGGIAGLTLANMLERLDINYQVLEGYSTLTPQVGASIGLLPNGLRIYDQIGLADNVRTLIKRSSQKTFVRAPGSTNVVYQYPDGMADQVLARHSYEFIFVDRQLILERLYQNLKHKNKVLTSKKVDQVVIEPARVKVITTDGSTYTGDILVGADGVHSKVRSEMWRLADLLEPGWIPQSEHTNSLHTTHKCLFGISVTKAYTPDSSQTHMNNGFSHLTVAGPDDKVYWFLIVDMKQTYHLHDLPRFTAEDEALLVKEHAADRLTDELSFGQLYAARTSSTLTALPEYVFKKWHYNRIITTGDASHKFNPISGQGGNSAIETNAVLVNNLYALLQKNPHPTTAEIHAVFAATQAKRIRRAECLVQQATDEQAFVAQERLGTGLGVKLLSMTNFDQLFAAKSDVIEGAPRLDMLPVPKRPRALPFHDELPAFPLASSVLPKIVTAVALAVLFYVATQALSIGEWTGSTPTSTFVNHPLVRTYTGYPDVDRFLSSLVFAFSEAVAGTNPFQKIQGAYFLVNLLPVIYIWTVESYRNGNHCAVGVSLPVIFLSLAQILGFGKIAPLYFLISLYTTAATPYTRTTGRPIPSPVAKALLPAIVLGYILPTFMMYLPRAGSDVDGHQATQLAVAFWQPYPLYVAGLTWLLSKVINTASVKPVKPFDFEIFDNVDLAPLQAGYAVVVALTAITHAAMAWYASTPTAAVALLDAFFNLPAASAVETGAAAGDFYGFFKYDFVLTFAAVLLWSLYSVFALRRLGYITSTMAVKAGVAVLVGQVIVGPGATYAGLWAWREDVIASIAGN